MADTATLGAADANWSRLRYQAVAWFGIVGAAATLLGHLGSLFEFANITKVSLSAWVAALAGAWRSVLFFVPTVEAYDALLLSLFSFLVMNSVNASSRPIDGIRWTTRILVGVALIVAASVFGMIFTLASSGEDASSSLIMEAYAHLMEPIGGIALPMLGSIPTFGSQLLEMLVYFLIMFVIWFLVPIVAAAIVIALLDYAFGVRFNLAAFTVRIWKILFCFFGLIGLNYLALWGERGFSTPPPPFIPG